MKNRVISALIGIMALSLAACAATPDTTATEPEAKEEAPAETPEATPETTPDAAPETTEDTAEDTDITEEVVDKPDFTGTYTEPIAGRCNIDIEYLSGDDYKVNVHWAGSAFESSNWEMTATYYESTGLLEYTDAKYYIRTYTDEDTYTDDVQYTDGAGEFWFAEDGSLGWRSANSDIDYITGETFFERLPVNTGMANPWTDVDSADAAAEGAEVGYFMVPKSGEMYNDYLIYLTEFRYMEHLAEVRGSAGSAELTIRKGLKQESDDVSGDYNTYAYDWSFETEGGLTVNCYGNEKGKTMKAVWLSDNFSYSINIMGQGDEADTFGLDDETMKLLVEDIQ